MAVYMAIYSLKNIKLFREIGFALVILNGYGGNWRCKNQVFQ